MRYAWIALPFAVLVLSAVADPPADKKPPADDKKSKNLVVNGDLEEGDDTPKGWQKVDGLTTFWVKDSDPAHGKVLKFDTDVLQSQGYDWWVKIAQGARAKDAPKKIPSKDPNKYDTLAGLDGVWFWSDFIPIEKDKAYWLTLDVKGPEIMTWLVGYPEKSSTDFGADAGAFQEYMKAKLTGKEPNFTREREGFINKYDWRGQLKAGGGNEWKTYSRRKMPFRPTANTPQVKFVRVLIFPYWPPGEYYVDNVRLVEYDEKAEAPR
jgi:hypothetical protein